MTRRTTRHRKAGATAGAVLFVALVAAIRAEHQAAPVPAPGPSIVEARVVRYFDAIRTEPPALRAFLRAMPKGADLHSHLTGAVYAESYIAWAVDMQLCVDTSTMAFVDPPDSQPRSGAAGAVPQRTCREADGQRPASDALRDPTLYRSLIDALSTRNWHVAQAAGHYQFFDAFRGFGAVARGNRQTSATIVAKSVAEVAQRAALQNVLHLELMMAFDGVIPGSERQAAVTGGEEFGRARDALLAGGLRTRVEERQRWLDAVEKEARAALRCDAQTALAGCGVSIRYMAYALRGLPPPQVFAQALFAFELAAADRRMAGVNLVMPEDWFVPMRDYELHMRMYRFLRTHYPGVNVSLHAGELTLGLVPPETLGLHVRQAVEIAGAQRIGHATDVMYDEHPEELLQQMARRGIAVEVGLSSSDLILGIRGPKHPLRQILRAGVPVVLATDDEGVARSDLTNEYQRAVEEQGVSYLQLKKMSRNSLEYSFLATADKARLLRQLDAAFTEFERNVGTTTPGTRQ